MEVDSVVHENCEHANDEYMYAFPPAVLKQLLLANIHCQNFVFWMQERMNSL
jgi:hypothetical protein